MVLLLAYAVRIAERHSFGPYFEGMSNPYEKFDSEENQKAYELSQRQRLLERRIRGTKRQVMDYKAAMDGAPDGDMKAAMERKYQRKAALLQKQNKQYNAFCEEHDRKRLADRLAVANWDRKQSAAATGAARKWNNEHND